jgi:hypothetical protein
LLLFLPGATSSASGSEYGRAIMEITFPAEAVVGRREPLVSSADGRDVLYVWYSGKSEIRLGFHHLGAGGPVSPPYPIEPDHPYRLELNLGCFYPEPTDPAFAGWPPARVTAARHRLTALLDRHLLLDQQVEFFPGSPAQIRFGENPGPYAAPGRFSGRLTLLHRQGIPAKPNPAADFPGGAMRLTVRFPRFTEPRTEPLLSLGAPGSGELLYVVYAGPGLLRFGHDTWGGGAVETAMLTYEPESPQTLELTLPSLSADDTPFGPLVLRYNGELALYAQRPRHPGGRSSLQAGVNHAGSTATTREFSGEIERVLGIERVSTDSGADLHGSGPIRLRLRLPENATGRSEPLLTTGRNGAADVIYLQYVDAAHLRIGHDHWGADGPLSPPIPIDYAAEHTLELELGSLFPPPDDPVWATVPATARESALAWTRVLLDGTPVLEHRQPAHPINPDELHIGINPVGASTCGPAFTGRILRRERLGLRPPP